jgi:hypothetical protein
MTRLLLIGILLTLSEISFGQGDTIKYKQFGDSQEFSELNLVSDNTFNFHHYNIRSCWTWYSVWGSWKKEKENIIFIDTVQWREENLRIDTSIQNTDFVLIRVKSDRGKPLKGIRIKYGNLWVDKPETYVTNKYGEIKVSKLSIYKQKSKDQGNNVQFLIDYWNRRNSKCSMSTSFESYYDFIQVTILEDPKEEDIVRTTTYKSDGSKIYFLSQQFSRDRGYWEKSWGNFLQEVP